MLVAFGPVVVATRVGQQHLVLGVLVFLLSLALHPVRLAFELVMLLIEPPQFRFASLQLSPQIGVLARVDELGECAAGISDGRVDLAAASIERLGRLFVLLLGFLKQAIGSRDLFIELAALLFQFRNRCHGRLQRHAALVVLDVFAQVIERLAGLGQQAFDVGGVGLLSGGDGGNQLAVTGDGR